MAIIRTPITDDDGTGTTGTVIDNAWKTELYNQIDAQVAAIPVPPPTLPNSGSWTPTDTSGAGLAFQAGTVGYWAKDGRVVWIWSQVIYPSTTNPNASSIGGLPYVVRTPTGAAQGFGTAHIFYLTLNGTNVQLYQTTGAQQANNNVSGMALIFSACYLTD